MPQPEYKSLVDDNGLGLYFSFCSRHCCQTASVSAQHATLSFCSSPTMEHNPHLVKVTAASNLQTAIHYHGQRVSLFPSP